MTQMLEELKEQILGPSNYLHIGASVQHLHPDCIDTEAEFHIRVDEYRSALEALVADRTSLQSLYDMLVGMDEFIDNTLRVSDGAFVSSRMTFPYKGELYELTVFQVQYIRFIRYIKPFKARPC